MTFGKTTAGAQIWYRPENTKIGTIYYTPGETVEVIIARFRNDRSAALPRVRAAIYDASNLALVTYSDEILMTVEDHLEIKQWVFQLPVASVLPEGQYILVLHVGGYGAILFSYDGGVAQNARGNVDAYDDGPSDPFDADSAVEMSWQDFDIFATTSIPQPPEAKFSVDPMPAEAGKPTSFDASLSTPGWTGVEVSPIVSWDWVLGDGSEKSGEVINHTYELEGTYDITLTVTDMQGLSDSIIYRLYVAPEGGLTSFTVTFEHPEDFKVGVECIGDYVYWDRGGYALQQNPLDSFFVPETSIVYEGTQSAKLELLNPVTDSKRRVQIYHDWNPLTSIHLWNEGFFYLTPELPWLSGTGEILWFTLHSIIHERLWNPILPMPYQEKGIKLGILWHQYRDKPVFIFSQGPERVDNNDDGVDDWIPPADQYFELGDEGVPKGVWIRIQSHAYRNIEAPNAGYIEFWIENMETGETIYHMEDPCRTIGIDPNRLNSLPCYCHTPGMDGLCAWLSQGFMLYAGGLGGGMPEIPMKIFVDNVHMAATGPPMHTLSVSSSPTTGIPFTIDGEDAVTPYMEDLVEGEKTISMPSNVVIGSDTYNFLDWEDGSTNPIRTVDLVEDLLIEANYQLQLVTALEVHAFYNEGEVVADGLIIETGFTFQTQVGGTLIEVDPGTYTVRLTYETVTKSYTTTAAEGETIRVDGQLAPPTPSKLPIWVLAIPIGLMLLSSKGKKGRG